MDEATFEQECLRAHNYYRKLHNVPPLKLNKEICKVSKNWARHLLSKNQMVHSGNRTYGENLYMTASSNSSYTISGEEAVKSWYDEISLYDFNKPDFRPGTGHFTQVVWKSSQELGVGFAKSGGTIYVVANYLPPGNFMGRFAENVPLPLKAGVESAKGDKEIKEVDKLSHNVSKLTINPINSVIHISGNFEEDCLKAHNAFRKRHGCEPLSLDKKLSEFAENRAKSILKTNSSNESDSPYGENVYIITNVNGLVGSCPVEYWYEGIKHHRFGKEPKDSKSLNFTQVIWKSSKLLGVGVAKNDKKVVVVATYSPSGNFMGSFVPNCPPVKPTIF